MVFLSHILKAGMPIKVSPSCLHNTQQKNSFFLNVYTNIICIIGFFSPLQSPFHGIQFHSFFFQQQTIFIISRRSTTINVCHFVQTNDYHSWLWSYWQLSQMWTINVNVSSLLAPRFHYLLTDQKILFLPFLWYILNPWNSAKTMLVYLLLNKLIKCLETNWLLLSQKQIVALPNDN
jgi:hypothetical protein